MSYDIKISDLTSSTKTTDGEGVYDLLSQSVVRQIETQYNQGRLSGTDYANVLLGSIQSVLAESVRFVLTEKTSEEQAALLAEQVKSEIKNNEINGVIDAQKNKILSDVALTDTQTLKVTAEKLLVDAQQAEVAPNALSQREVATSNIAVNTSQISKLAADKLLVDSQKSELELNGTSQRLVNTSQIAKIDKDALFVAEQVKSEVKNNELDGILDKQKLKIVEDIDLVVRQESELALNGTAERLLTAARTATQEEQTKSEIKSNELDGLIDKQKLKIIEDIDASQKESTRRSLLNSAEIAHREKETILVTTQEFELSLNGVVERELNVAKKASIQSAALDSTNKTNADIVLVNTQKDKVASEKVLVDSQNAEVALNAASQRSVNTSTISKIASETALLTSRDAATAAEVIRSDAESAQRVLLMQAQTTGFKTDAKQKLMRQLYEGYAVNVTTAGEVTQSPNGSTAAALDSVANDILDDLNSIVNISTEYPVVP